MILHETESLWKSQSPQVWSPSSNTLCGNKSLPIGKPTRASFLMTGQPPTLTNLNDGCRNHADANAEKQLPVFELNIT